ncbi:tetratricopeptide repeat protein [Streptosporangium sp. NPDC023963]|uniref:tetratricopeptide repeat protein n=1 Tax=Streptosporangium sp. NPDC023963 TaxID=3155608 RepID=UPI003414010C
MSDRDDKSSWTRWRHRPSGPPPSHTGPGNVQINAPHPGATVNAVQGGVLNVFQWKPAYRIEDYPFQPQSVQPGRLRQQPSLLLRAGRQVVPFTGREGELAQLSAWRDDAEEPGLAVRLVHGPGGQGKTRLAARFAELSQAAGWRVWQAEANPAGAGVTAPVAVADPDRRNRDSGWGRGLVVVVDYAERWPLPALHELLQEPLLHHGGAVRVLVLARPAGGWWQSITSWIDKRLNAPADALKLAALAPQPGQRGELFAQARDHFASHLGLPAERAGRIEPPPGIEGDAAYAQVLTIHIAALAAVDAHRHGRQKPDNPAQASAYLLAREREHWTALHQRSPQPLASDPATMGRAVFVATLTRPLARAHGWQALRHAGLAESVQAANTVLDDHQYCYPPAQADTVLEPLYPDRLGEDFLALAMPGHTVTTAPSDDWARHAATRLLLATDHAYQDLENQHGTQRSRDNASDRKGLDDLDEGIVLPWTRAALTVLIETARRWPHVAGDQLYPLITTHPQLFLHAGGVALAALADLPDIDLAALGALEAHLPPDRHIDLDIGVAAVTARLTAHRLAITSDPAQRAALYLSLSWRLVNAGQHEPALAATQEAVALYGELARLNRTAHLPHLAMSLNTHAVRLAEVGRRDEAVPVSHEAVTLYQELVRLNRTAHLPNLAASLNNHAMRLAEVGRRDEAVPVSHEAVTLYQELVQLNRTAHLPNLTASLNNHAALLAEVGRRDEAVPVSHEAVTLRQELVRLNRAAHLPDLTASLNNHAALLAEVGRRDEAIPVSHEAVTLYEELVGLNRAAYLPDLARSLNNHANRLAEVGRRDEAVPVSHEAVALRQELVRLNRAAHLPDLAASLNNHAVRLAEVGRRDEAVSVSHEAVTFYEELVGLNRAAHLPHLAASLNNHAVRLAEVGRRDEAVPVSHEAVTFYEELVGLNRAAHLPDLTASLNNHAALLAEVGRRDEAIPVSHEAVTLYEELVGLNRAAYLPHLARSLNNHANRLAEVGQRDEAVSVSHEAVALRQELVRLNRAAHLPHLAASLNNHAALLAEVGRRDEAVPVSHEAVTLYEELVGLNRAAHLPHLAASLNNHAALLAEVGRRDEAVPVSHEAVTLRRELVRLNRTAYLPDLAASLNNHAVLLAEVGRRDEAVPVSREAVTLYEELVRLNRAAHLPSYTQSLAALGYVLVEGAQFREAVTPLVAALVRGQELPVYAQNSLGAVFDLLRQAYAGDAAGVAKEFRVLTGQSVPDWMKQPPAAE